MGRGQWGRETPGTEGAIHLVEVVEGRPELLHLLLADALGITGEDLVLDLVDGAGDGGEQLLPAHADVLGIEQGHECVLGGRGDRCHQGPGAWLSSSSPHTGCSSGLEVG